LLKQSEKDALGHAIEAGRRVLFAAILLSLGGAVPACAAEQKPVIVGYVFPQNHPIQPGEIAARKLTRINYAFANIDHGLMVNGFADDDENLELLTSLKRENPSLTVLVSVGGWLWSGAFSDVALTRQSRTAFIDSVVEFVRRDQLDGLDIDWEYPGMPGKESNFRAEDKQNFTFLVKELRSRFDHLQKEVHRRLYVTVATGSSPDFLAHTEMDKVQKYVDTVNLMAYDYYEPSSDGITGHHAPLHVNPADPRRISAEGSVQDYEKAGVPAAKIVLGVPFYGHAWGEVPNAHFGLFQPGKEIPHAYEQYGTRPEAMLQDGFTRYWDADASAPYLYSPDKGVFLSYEDEESLGLKCKYVLDHGLRGVMFWDYEADASGHLLDAVNRGLEKNSGTRDVRK